MKFTTPKRGFVFYGMIISYVAACHAQAQNPMPDAATYDAAEKRCDLSASEGDSMFPVWNERRSKWDCSVCDGNMYRHPKTGRKSCCDDPATTFSVDANMPTEGACCRKDKHFSWDATAGAGGCCAPGEQYKGDHCEAATKPTTEVIVDDNTSRNVCSKSFACARDGHYGIRYGACYTMIDTNGLALGRELTGINSGTYQSGSDNTPLIFRVCKSTTDCSAGQYIPDGGSWYLQDQMGIRDGKGPGWFGHIQPHMAVVPASEPQTAAHFTAEPFCVFGDCALCLRLASAPDGRLGLSSPCPLGVLAEHGHIGGAINANNCKMMRFQEIKCMKDV